MLIKINVSCYFTINTITNVLLATIIWLLDKVFFLFTYTTEDLYLSGQYKCVRSSDKNQHFLLTRVALSICINMKSVIYLVISVIQKLEAEMKYSKLLGSDHSLETTSSGIEHISLSREVITEVGLGTGEELSLALQQLDLSDEGNEDKDDANEMIQMKNSDLVEATFENSNLSEEKLTNMTKSIGNTDCMTQTGNTSTQPVNVLTERDLQCHNENNVSCDSEDCLEKQNTEMSEKWCREKMNGFNTNEIKKYKLVVTYVFHFDTDEDDKNEAHKENSFLSRVNSLDSDLDLDSLEDNEGLISQGGAMCGSKNNLLDESMEFSTTEGSFEEELDKALESDELVKVSYLSDDEDDSDDGDDDYNNSNNGDDHKQGLESTVSSVSCDSSDKGDSSSSSVNANIRKGYTYYSSEANLYTGELYYSHCDLSKRVEARKRGKYKLVRKLFKKVFPSQKYVLN